MTLRLLQFVHIHPDFTFEILELEWSSAAARQLLEGCRAYKRHGVGDAGTDHITSFKTWSEPKGSSSHRIDLNFPVLWPRPRPNRVLDLGWFAATGQSFYCIVNGESWDKHMLSLGQVPRYATSPEEGALRLSRFTLKKDLVGFGSRGRQHYVEIEHAGDYHDSTPTPVILTEDNLEELCKAAEVLEEEEGEIVEEDKTPSGRHMYHHIELYDDLKNNASLRRLMNLRRALEKGLLNIPVIFEVYTKPEKVVSKSEYDSVGAIKARYVINKKQLAGSSVSLLEVGAFIAGYHAADR